MYQALSFEPNKQQREAIERIEGPVLIVAGPGSGKTATLIARTLNLIVCHNVDPEMILLCTFTEKAAAELMDRLRQAIIGLGLETKVDISNFWVGTIHSICNAIIDEFLGRMEALPLPLIKGYTVLDDLTQQLFLYEHFYEVLHHPEPFATSRWQSIQSAGRFFDTITEEWIDPDALAASRNERLAAIGRAYKRYREHLAWSNSVDFAHLQSLVLDMAQSKKLGPLLRSKFQYVMVDEYQDTNYVQEQLFFALTADTKNLCVVGDEDQSLYRFRGATVQNILQFPQHFKGLRPIPLAVNYRSRPDIIRFLNKYMKTADWSGPGGAEYRYPKTVERDPRTSPLKHAPHSVVWAGEDSAKAVARIVKAMIDGKVVKDANQIAVLLKSVAYDGEPIMQALAEEGVEYFAPRARGYFELEEVRIMLGALLDLFDHLETADPWDDNLYEYYEGCRREFRTRASAEAKRVVKDLRAWVHASEKPKGRQKGVVDFFYELLGTEPFVTWREQEPEARSLAILSDLLTKFQEYFHWPVVKVDRLDKLCHNLFDSFLFMLRRIGLDEYEDPYDIFPSGKVQIMTVHQAKGLEFPVVIVGSLHKRMRAQANPAYEMRAFLKRKLFEPEDRIAEFDYRRLFYVAFSRAMHLLLMYADKSPNRVFRPILEDVAGPDAAFMKGLAEERFTARERSPLKAEYGITSDIHVYDVCPKQYLLANEYSFAPSIGGQFKFGLLVHRTIEDIHNHYLQGRGDITDDVIDNYFDRNVKAITRNGSHPLADVFKKLAEAQVKRYVNKNRDTFSQLIQAEVPVTVEKPTYILSGVVDLIRGKDGQTELLDFKAQQRKNGEEFLDKYREQLAIYSKVIEQRLGVKPTRFKIYWTAEENGDRNTQEIDITSADADRALQHFDDVVGKIESRNFAVSRKPPKDVCRNCDFRFGCKSANL